MKEINNIQDVFNHITGTLNKMQLNSVNVEDPQRYKCPYCGWVMGEDEAESVCDEGCPSCRRKFDVDKNVIEN